MISNSIVHSLTSSNSVEVEQGYVNATTICKALNKQWSNYYKLSSTKSYISSLAEHLNLPKHRLVITTSGGIPELQGTWIHPLLVEDLTNWCKMIRADKQEKVLIFKPASENPLLKKEIPVSTKGAISYSASDYINATTLCKTANKEWSDYSILKSTKAYILKLAKELDIPVSKVVVIIQGGLSKNQGTWIHPLLIPHISNWCNASPNVQKERIIQANFPEEGRREVICPAGKIDILTSEEIIEIKLATNWIAAIGQLIIYGSYYPNHKKRLHLFGCTSPSLIKLVENHCRKLDITFTYES